MAEFGARRERRATRGADGTVERCTARGAKAAAGRRCITRRAGRWRWHAGNLSRAKSNRLYYPAMNPPSPASTYGLGNVDEDRELVRRMSAGDTQALAQFYERWSRPVHALVVQLLRDPDDADDVVEDAFYQAWRQASRYEPSRGAVSTWIVTIARSRALDRLRSRRRLREEPLTPVTVLDELTA